LTTKPFALKTCSLSQCLTLTPTLSRWERVAEGRERVAEGRERVAEGRERVAEGRERVAEGRVRVAGGRVRVAGGRVRVSQGYGALPCHCSPIQGRV